MEAVINLDVPDFQINQEVTVHFKDTMVKHAVCRANLLVYCKDCKYSCMHYQLFENQYVCMKNADKYGRVPDIERQRHHGYWYCADGVRRKVSPGGSK